MERAQCACFSKYAPCSLIAPPGKKDDDGTADVIEIPKRTTPAAGKWWNVSEDPLFLVKGQRVILFPSSSVFKLRPHQGPGI